MTTEFEAQMALASQRWFGPCLNSLSSRRIREALNPSYFDRMADLAQRCFAAQKRAGL